MSRTRVGSTHSTYKREAVKGQDGFTVTVNGDNFSLVFTDADNGYDHAKDKVMVKKEE